MVDAEEECLVVAVACAGPSARPIATMKVVDRRFDRRADWVAS